MADDEKGFLEEVLDDMTMYGLVEASRDKNGKIDRVKAANLGAAYGYSFSDIQAMATSTEIHDQSGYGYSSKPNGPTDYSSQYCYEEIEDETKDEEYEWDFLDYLWLICRLAGIALFIYAVGVMG